MPALSTCGKIRIPLKLERDGFYRMIEKEVIVKNRDGIHARPAGMIVKLANQFKAQIFMEKDSEKINAKSIMGLITLGVVCNTALKISAEGEDAAQAVEALVNLIEKRFEE